MYCNNSWAQREKMEDANNSWAQREKMEDARGRWVSNEERSAPPCVSWRRAAERKRAGETYVDNSTESRPRCMFVSLFAQLDRCKLLQVSRNTVVCKTFSVVQRIRWKRVAWKSTPWKSTSSSSWEYRKALVLKLGLGEALVLELRDHAHVAL